MSRHLNDERGAVSRRTMLRWMAGAAGGAALASTGWPTAAFGHGSSCSGAARHLVSVAASPQGWMMGMCLVGSGTGVEPVLETFAVHGDRLVRAGDAALKWAENEWPRGLVIADDRVTVYANRMWTTRVVHEQEPVVLTGEEHLPADVDPADIISSDNGPVVTWVDDHVEGVILETRLGPTAERPTQGPWSRNTLPPPRCTTQIRNSTRWSSLPP